MATPQQYATGSDQQYQQQPNTEAQHRSQEGNRHRHRPRILSEKHRMKHELTPLQAHLVAMSGEFVGTIMFLWFALAATQSAVYNSNNDQSSIPVSTSIQTHVQDLQLCRESSTSQQHSDSPSSSVRGSSTASPAASSTQQSHSEWSLPAKCPTCEHYLSFQLKSSAALLRQHLSRLCSHNPSPSPTQRSRPASRSQGASSSKHS